MRAGLERIVSVLAASTFSVPSHLRFRLYGGWYEGMSPTRLVQNLTTEIEAEPFPLPFKYSLANAVRTTVLSVEFAYSLLAEPHHHLFDTFRKKANALRAIHCEHPSAVGCVQGITCPLLGMHTLLNARRPRCPDSTCAIDSQALIYRAEQKLVDTMLCTDLIYLAQQRNQDLVVVTSDDDLWPAIRLALYMGATLYHIEPRPTNLKSPSYTAGLAATYRPYAL